MDRGRRRRLCRSYAALSAFRVRFGAAALAAIAELPDTLREPATLFFIHDCSHQDIAAFLGLSVVTVNNRLHAARSHLQQRS